MITPTLEYEQKFWLNNIFTVAGVDEVGRGALAGPVVAAAVIFDTAHIPISGVRDSKTLSKKQKEHLQQSILDQSLYSGIGEASAQEIDTLGIVPATGLAMKRALEKIPVCRHVLIDGTPFKNVAILKEYQKQFIIKGDALCYSIAAASIIAKEYRDNLMKKLDQTYDGYSLSQNVGYGTTKHRKSIGQLGLSACHRLSFCKNIIFD